jgi:hypothetical protein
MTAVPSLLGAALAAGEGQPQCRGVRTGPCDVGTGEEARERRVVDLAVSLAVIVLLDPSLCRLVKPGQRESFDALQHSHQPALDRSPEGLLFAVLIVTWLIS